MAQVRVVGNTPLRLFSTACANLASTCAGRSRGSSGRGRTDKACAVRKSLSACRRKASARATRCEDHMGRVYCGPWVLSFWSRRPAREFDLLILAGGGHRTSASRRSMDRTRGSPRSRADRSCSGLARHSLSAPGRAKCGGRADSTENNSSSAGPGKFFTTSSRCKSWWFDAANQTARTRGSSVRRACSSTS